jgi:uncharacterized membrane-anchored protein YjiN (DUF445 family)
MNETETQNMDIVTITKVAEELSPVKTIEKTLAKFVSDTFEMAIAEDNYQKAIKDEIIAKLPDMKASELIALITSASTNKNDLISKIISPTFSLLTAAQQNEMSLRQKETMPNISQTNIREVNAAASVETLQGLQALHHLLNATKTIIPVEGEHRIEPTS